MSKLVKIAFIIAVATLAIAATRLIPAQVDKSGTPAWSGVSISPEEMMRAAGPLPETKVDSYQ